MDLLTALVLLRRGLNAGVCLSAIGGEERRFFLFFDFYNIFLNYLKIYVCIYFLCVCLFNFWDSFTVFSRSKYERNTSYTKLTCSKVPKKYQKSSLRSFSYVCPFNFLGHFLSHLQDIVKICLI